MAKSRRKSNSVNSYPPLTATCNHCDGDGSVGPSVAESVRCPACHGRGELLTEFGEAVLDAVRTHGSPPPPVEQPTREITVDQTVSEIARHWHDKLPPQTQHKVGAEFHPARDNNIRMFLNRGLGFDEIIDSVNVTHDRVGLTDMGTDAEGAWRYFCGVCWNKIRVLEASR